MKRIIALLLSFALLFTLAVGCSGSSTPADTTGNPSSDNSNTAAAETGDKADDTVYDFIVQNWDPGSSICAMYVEVLGGIMNEKSNGRMTFTYYHGGSLVGAKDTLPAVQNGVCDMAWGACSAFAGVFPISEGAGLPYNGVTCGRMGTKVLWDLYQNYEPLQKEYESVVPISLYCTTTVPLSTTTVKIETVKDLKGLMIRVPNSAVGLWCSQLGLTPQTIANPETYESLEKNVINGCLNDWHNLHAFSLLEVLDYIMDVPACHSPAWVLMNKDKYDSLPDDLKAIVDEMAGGFATELAADAWDYTRSWVMDKTAAAGVEVYKPTAEVEAAMENAAVAAAKDYITYCDGFGLNGQEISDKYSELVAKYADQYKDPWTNFESEFIPYMEKYYSK